MAQMKLDAEQLYHKLGELSASADETQAQLSSRARQAEAEVVRLRLHAGRIEDSADALTEEQEQTAGETHMTRACNLILPDRTGVRSTVVRG